MSRMRSGVAAAIVFLLASATCVLAADTEAVGNAPNFSAIVMFLVFASATLLITYWAANRTRSAADFYAAGGGITGVQNGLAIAGDYMSAASFLGISGPRLRQRLSTD